MYINDHHASFYTGEQTYYENPRGLLQSEKKPDTYKKSGGKERVARGDKKKKIK